MEENYVNAPAEGFAIGLGYWDGDELRAMRVARLLADIEPRPRFDVALVLCRRFDCAESDLARDTLAYCRRKFPAMLARSSVEGTGHPAGSNGLWSGMVSQVAALWGMGNGHPSVFTIEHDGVPLSRDWIDRLKAEHERALSAGKRVSGCLMGRPGPTPHVNGTLMMHLSMAIDRPSIMNTPSDQAWDVFHRVAFASECRRTSLIRNIYGARGWQPDTLRALAKETAWLASTKDDSALEWAERELVA